MSTQNEEIVAKFGADTGPLDAGLRKLKSGVKEAGEHSHGSFVHASNGARQFHKVMHEITAQSPLMGGALQLAISPIGGTFMLAALALGGFVERMKEVNAEMDKAGKAAAQPVSNVKDNMREAKKDAQEIRREFEKWVKGLKTDDTLEKLKMTIAEVGGKGKTASEAATAAGDPKAAAEIEKKALQAQFRLQAQTLMKTSDKKLHIADEIGTYERILETKMGQTRIKNAEQATKAEEEFQKSQQEEFERKQKEFTGTGGVIWDALKNAFGAGPGADELAKERANELSDLQTAIKASKKRVETNKDVIERENTQRKAVADVLEELKKKYADQKGIFDALSNELEATRAKLAGIRSPVDRRPQTVKDAEEGVNKLLKGNTDWQKKQQTALDDWNKAHGIAPMGSKDALGVIHNEKENPVTLSQFKDWLDKVLNSQGITFKVKD